MFGRFLFGVFSGSALVACGFVLAAALFPLAPPAVIATSGEAGTIAPDPVASAPILPETTTAAVAEAPPPEAQPEADAAPLVEPLPEAVEETPAPAPTEPESAPQPPVPDSPAAPEGEPADQPVAEPEVAVAPEVETAPKVDAAVARPQDPLPGTAAEVVPEPVAAPVAEPVPDPGTEAIAELAPEVTPEPAPEEAAAVPASESAGNAEIVVVDRLPRTAEAPVVEDPATADPTTDPAAATPLTTYDEPFENTDNKPVFAIVLIDLGTATLDRAGLAALPFPVSFALDPLDPATPERVALYRAGGKEVLMLATGIATGAQASDIEVAFQSMAQGLPEAVAVMDLDGSLFQNNRPVASLVVPVVQAQGRGLVTWDIGLNAADQVARREDVPAAVVFRDLAASGADGAAIQRILGRAVFKAGQDGRVVVAATASPELVAALLGWSVEGKSASVALAPVSAALTVE